MSTKFFIGATADLVIFFGEVLKATIELRFFGDDPSSTLGQEALIPSSRGFTTIA